MRTYLTGQRRLPTPVIHPGQLLSCIDLHDVKADKFVVEPFEGGSCEISFRVGTSDVDETYLGRLGMKLGREVMITLHAPEAKPEPIDGTTEAFERDHPAEEPDATDLFAESIEGDGE